MRYSPLLLLLFSVPGYAAAVDEIDLKTSFSNEIVIETSIFEVRSSDKANSIGGGIGYHHSVSPWIQLGGKVSGGYATGGIGWNVQTSVGPTLNWIYNGNLRNAFFFNPTVGVDYRSADSGQANFFVRADVGKRFEIFDALSYRPTVGVIKHESSSDPVFVVTPVSFSLNF